MDDLIYLVAQTYETDALNQRIPVESKTPVWATIQSVTRAEFADAGQVGLQPQLVAVTPLVNYHGEQIVQLGDGEDAPRYGVYRTFFGPDSDTIELYLERKVGLSGADSQN